MTTNVKVLVKSMGANVDATHILSESGRIDIPKLTEAFISGDAQPAAGNPHGHS